MSIAATLLAACCANRVQRVRVSGREALMQLAGLRRAAARPAALQCVAACCWLCLLLVCSSRSVVAAPNELPRASATQIVATMLANEDAASRSRDRYTYLSQERSDRTGGHLWTEKVVEIGAGTIRMLIAEDGKPLDSQRIARERTRLAEIVADPAAFERKAQSRNDDQNHARQMEWLVGRAFDFSNVRVEDGYLRIDFTPNPDFKPESFEQRVMHRMAGTMLIDPHTMRLRRLDGRLLHDVNFGWGILARIKAGSGFDVTRDDPGVPDWKTTEYDTSFIGRILFFKSLMWNAHAVHSNFVCVPNDISVAQAVALVEQ